MSWVYNIFSFVWDIAFFFYDAYLETKGWWIVGPIFSGICWGLYRVFWSLLTPIALFAEWTGEVWSKIQNILTSGGVLGLIKWWFPWLYDVGEWFYGRWQWFTTAVGNWWGTTKTTVLGWIDIATEGLDALKVGWDKFWKITWPEWMSKLDVLKSGWDNFWRDTLPNLLDNLKLENWWNGKLFAIDGLIGSKLAEWFPFYNDIAEFFSNPGEFLLAKLTDWFLGPEE